MTEQSPDLKTRAGLARAITLVESRKASHQSKARKLLEQVMPQTGKSMRIGVTGVPGVGKSTFIDRFGELIISKGRRLAILAVDPSSRRTGGSILGDKTRMASLVGHPDVFIRPSPAGDTLGGAASRTRETILLCEAAGYDTIIVETVGVGQSETVVADMVDLCLLLMLPNAGDDLQGIKKGVLEIADLIAINKCDLDEAAARRAKQTYETALHISASMRTDETPPVTLISGAHGHGLDDLWSTLQNTHDKRTHAGLLSQRRSKQQSRWFEDMIEDGLKYRFESSPTIKDKLSQVRANVASGQQPASSAADSMLSLFLGSLDLTTES